MLEDLALGLDDSSAAHLLVLSQDADNLGLVLLDGLSKIRRDVLGRVYLQGILGLARCEGEPGL